jgi:hypothetical protein
MLESGYRPEPTMKKSLIASLIALSIALFTATLALSSLDVFAQTPAVAADKKAQSVALFMQMHPVLSHPRCVNCHPRDDSPKQGLERRVHYPPITRGPKNDGPVGLACSACHQTANYDHARVPGAPNWHLAPASMAWEGLSAGELCRSMTERAKNGNKSLQDTVRHLTDDKLVAWGWAPGIDVYGRARQPVPLPKEEFNRIVVAWAQTGGACPD